MCWALTNRAHALALIPLKLVDVILAQATRFHAIQEPRAHKARPQAKSKAHTELRVLEDLRCESMLRLGRSSNSNLYSFCKAATYVQQHSKVSGRALCNHLCALHLEKDRATLDATVELPGTLPRSMKQHFEFVQVGCQAQGVEAIADCFYPCGQMLK
eukprot:6492728-Amphidinium_carterae.1